MTTTNNADFFLNFQQFGDLKLQAKQQTGEASIAVAQQFEGLFMQQMLAAMRSASKIDSAQHSSYVDFYQEMHDKQLAQTMSKQGSLGVARLIMQQLPGAPVETGETTAIGSLPFLPGPNLAGAMAIAHPLANSGMRIQAANPMPQAVMSAEKRSAVPSLEEPDEPTTLLSQVKDDDFAELKQIRQQQARWQAPQNFIADIWPEAQQAANRLGVSPGLLVAQSALETGWGRHTMKLDDGRSSYNLFGIKAGADWKGPVIARSSLEYSGGSLQNEVSRFRAYASPAESLSDYVEFIQASPRYSDAIKNGTDDQGYIREIQRAGYATDPDYADKVLAIFNGELLNGTLASLDTGATRNV